MRRLLLRVLRSRAGSVRLISVVLAAYSVTVQAEPAPPFPRLLMQAGTSPRLLESEEYVRRAEGFARQATARPNPWVGALTNNIAATGPYARIAPAETTLQYSQPIELGDKRAARIAAGEAGVGSAKARYREVRIAFAHELARAYGAAEHAGRRIGLIEDEVANANNDLRAARALVDAGREARLRSLQAEAAVNALQAELDGARAARVGALARLSALVGGGAQYDGVADTLLDLGAYRGMRTVLPSESAAYLAAVAERDETEQRVVAERKRTLPDLTASVGVRSDFTNNNALVAGVSIPLRILDRNEGNIAAALANYHAAQARAAIARNEMEAQARSVPLQLGAAEASLDAALLAESTAQEAYRLARIAYDAGKSSLLELVSSRRSLGIARRMALDARLARLEAIAALARLQNRTVLGDPIP